VGTWLRRVVAIRPPITTTLLVAALLVVVVAALVVSAGIEPVHPIGNANGGFPCPTGWTSVWEQDPAQNGTYVHRCVQSPPP
jgi:hypothetical protein